MGGEGIQMRRGGRGRKARASKGGVTVVCGEKVKFIAILKYSSYFVVPSGQILDSINPVMTSRSKSVVIFGYL